MFSYVANALCDIVIKSLPGLHDPLQILVYPGLEPGNLNFSI